MSGPRLIRTVRAKCSYKTSGPQLNLFLDKKKKIQKTLLQMLKCSHHCSLINKYAHDKVVSI